MYQGEHFNGTDKALVNLFDNCGIRCVHIYIVLDLH